MKHYSFNRGFASPRAGGATGFLTFPQGVGGQPSMRTGCSGSVRQARMPSGGSWGPRLRPAASPPVPRSAVSRPCPAIESAWDARPAMGRVYSPRDATAEPMPSMGGGKHGGQWDGDQPAMAIGAVRSAAGPIMRETWGGTESRSRRRTARRPMGCAKNPSAFSPLATIPGGPHDPWPVFAAKAGGLPGEPGVLEKRGFMERGVPFRGARWCGNTSIPPRRKGIAGPDQTPDV